MLTTISIRLGIYDYKATQLCDLGAIGASYV